MENTTVEQQANALANKYSDELHNLEEAHFQMCLDARMDGETCNILSPFLPSSSSHIQALKDIAGSNLIPRTHFLSLTCHMFNLIELTSEDIILDIGCGDGRVLISLCKAIGCRGLGLDISHVMNALHDTIIPPTKTPP